jgi:factor associated with neutral sphingomyelinase activation
MERFTLETVWAIAIILNHFQIRGNPQLRQEKGRLHLCSRSLMFEPDDTETPLVRYSFRDIPEAPLEVFAPRTPLSNTENTSRISFRVNKMTILPHTKYPAQYRTVTFDRPQIVQLEFVYESASSICTWINDLYSRNSKNSPGFDVDAELADLVTQRERGIRFDMSRIESITEKPLVQAPYLVKRIHPFMSLAGLLFVTDQRVYFQPVYRVSAKPVKSVRYDQIVKLYRRRYKLRNIGFELYTSSNKSLFIAFYSEKERDQIYSLLISLVSPECETEGSVENMTLKWQLKQISNFDYILYLNSAAYRTVSDFTQYPVFPWVIADYDSPELNFNNPATFRDLSKPIGGLNPERLNNYRLRYNDMPEPKFLYGTHYSVPGYVIGFLFRKYPLYMLRLHVRYI